MKIKRYMRLLMVTAIIVVQSDSAQASSAKEDMVKAVPSLERTVKESKRKKNCKEKKEKSNDQKDNRRKIQEEIKQKREKNAEIEKYNDFYRVYSKKSKPSIKTRIIMAEQHGHIEKTIALKKRKIKYKMQELEEEYKKLLKLENHRVQMESQDKKERALLDARHAQTIKDQKYYDYLSGRIHGRLEHPKFKHLRRKNADCRSLLQLFNCIENNHKWHKMRNYNRSGLTCLDDQYAVQSRNQDIIGGKALKHVRRLPGESREDIQLKDKIEVKRQEYQKYRDHMKSHHKAQCRKKRQEKKEKERRKQAKKNAQ